jgi:hypothetical protein
MKDETANSDRGRYQAGAGRSSLHDRADKEHNSTVALPDARVVRYSSQL